MKTFEPERIHTLFAALFHGPAGDEALEYLRAMTLNMAMGAHVSNEKLWHLEGQRWLVNQIIKMVEQVDMDDKDQLKYMLVEVSHYTDLQRKCAALQDALDKANAHIANGTDYAETNRELQRQRDLLLATLRAGTWFYARAAKIVEKFQGISLTGNEEGKSTVCINPRHPYGCGCENDQSQAARPPEHNTEG